MTAVTFDTLEFTEQLRASGVPDEQAKGHAKAMVRLMERVEESRLQERRLQDVVTRGDLRDVKAGLAELEARIELTRAELQKEIEKGKSETIRWVIAVSAGQAAFILAVLKLFPFH
ncbi:MAG: DUF1640 domain-containing protein [Magnetococcales bacterium]|nr:DUF1640 domain-containing protein [Magnetococcales bacterium]